MATAAESIRVLIVDDSAFHRRQIARSLEKDERIRVVGQAANGREAVRLAQELRPDVITMDVVMPVMDGITAVRQIMAVQPTRIVMFTAYSDQNANAALDAMQAGAIEFVAKDVDRLFDEEVSGAEQLRISVKNLCARGAHKPYEAPQTRSVLTPARSRSPAASRRPELIVIGASTGGPVAIQEIIAALPADFAVPVLVAVHMPEGFSSVFARRLDQIGRVRVAEAGDGDVLAAGRVLIAPGGRQTVVERRAGGLRVSVRSVKGELYRPSINLALSSAAEALGGRVLGIVMTGMGADGSLGARDLKRAGGIVWTQSADTCVVYGMPKAVDLAGLSDRQVPLAHLGAELAEL